MPSFGAVSYLTIGSDPNLSPDPGYGLDHHITGLWVALLLSVCLAVTRWFGSKTCVFLL